MEQLIVADTALAGFSSSCLQPDCSLLPSCISSLLSVSHFLRFPLQYWVNVCEEKVKVHEHWYLSYFTYSVCPLQVLWPWVRSKLYTTGYLTQFIVTFCLFRSLWHLVFSWPSQNHTSLQATQQVDKWSCEVDGYWRLDARRIFHGAYDCEIQNSECNQSRDLSWSVTVPAGKGQKREGKQTTTKIIKHKCSGFHLWLCLEIVNVWMAMTSSMLPSIYCPAFIYLFLVYSLDSSTIKG